MWTTLPPNHLLLISAGRITESALLFPVRTIHMVPLTPTPSIMWEMHGLQASLMLTFTCSHAVESLLTLRSQIWYLEWAGKTMVRSGSTSKPTLHQVAAGLASLVHPTASTFPNLSMQLEPMAASQVFTPTTICGNQSWEVLALALAS